MTSIESQHERIVRAADAVSDQMKKIAADDISRRMHPAAVGDLNHLRVGIGVRDQVHSDRSD